MPVKPIFDPEHLYFITTTAHNHAHLFRRDVVKRIILDSFHFMRTSGWLNLYAFVIMPNHIHLIAQFLEGHILSDVMRDFKKHTSKQIARQFLAEDDEKTVAALAEAGLERGHQFKVWEDNYDARNVFSTKFLEQKMTYIHYNPCQRQWKLVENPEDYVWSSARFYLADKPCIIPIDDAREVV